MRSLKISGLLVLMLASLAACTTSYSAAPGVASGQPTAAEAHLSLDSGASRDHGW